MKQYDGFPCNELGHCIFEGSGEWPKIDPVDLIEENGSTHRLSYLLVPGDGF